LAKFGIAVLIAIACAAGCSAKHPAIDPAVQHGYAIAYIEAPFPDSYRLEATITMPPQYENKSWTANYIMIAAERREVLEQPMYQVGLIYIGPTPPRVLRTFVATQEPRGKPLKYNEIAAVAVEAHRFVLSATHGMLMIEIDGKLVRSFPRSRIFRPDDHMYVQLGSEAMTPGDAISGTFSDISLVSGHSTRRNVVPTCRYSDRGLSLEPKEKLRKFNAVGVYDTSAPSFYIGCHRARSNVIAPIGRSRRSSRPAS
jgi:hypothetical protein